MKNYLRDMIFSVSLGVFLICSFQLMKNMRSAPAKVAMSAPTQAPTPPPPQPQPQGAVKNSLPQVHSNFRRAGSTIALQAIKTKTPGIYVVAIDGSGDALTLAEVLPHMKPNEKIFLKKGRHTWPEDYARYSNMEISGEGEDSILVIEKSIYQRGYDLKLESLKVINRDTIAAISVYEGHTLTLNNVILSGNNENSGIRVIASHIKAKNVKMERFYLAFHLENPYSVEIKDVFVSRSDYAIRYKSDEHIRIEKLEVMDLRYETIKFDPKYEGYITCVRCELGGNKANDTVRLEEEI